MYYDKCNALMCCLFVFRSIGKCFYILKLSQRIGIVAQAFVPSAELAACLAGAAQVVVAFAPFAHEFHAALVKNLVDSHIAEGWHFCASANLIEGSITILVLTNLGFGIDEKHIGIAKDANVVV